MLYGFSSRILEAHVLPLECQQCKHHIQRIKVFRLYFCVFSLPIVPLKKNISFECPHCNYIIDQTQFLKEQKDAGYDLKGIKTQIDDLVKDVKTPLYPIVIPLIFISCLIVIGYIHEHQKKRIVEAYLENPEENVLLLVKSTNSDDYPYTLFFVPEIGNESVVLLGSRQTFKTYSDAKFAMEAMTVSSKTLQDNFMEPLMLSKKFISKLSILHIRELPSLVDWKPAFTTVEQ